MLWPDSLFANAEATSTTRASTSSISCSACSELIPSNASPSFSMNLNSSLFLSSFATSRMLFVSAPTMFHLSKNTTGHASSSAHYFIASNQVLAPRHAARPSRAPTGSRRSSPWRHWSSSMLTSAGSSASSASSAMPLRALYYFAGHCARGSDLSDDAIALVDSVVIALVSNSV